MKTIVGVFISFILFFVSCQTRYQIAETPRVDNFDVSSQTNDTSLLNLISPYAKIYNNTMNDVVGYCGENLEKGYPEGKLGNAVADMFYHFTASECGFTLDNSFVLINNGGLRTSWPKGPITRSLVFELMPFENVFSVVEIKGIHLRTGMANNIFDKKGQPVSGNMKIVFKEGKLLSMKLNGKEVSNDQVYYIITSDYLSSGGDKMDFFKNGKTNETVISGIKLRDVLMRGMKEITNENNPLIVTNFGRIVIE